eukprot:11940362-Alexandrium_andersonii.AAC.1
MCIRDSYCSRPSLPLLMLGRGEGLLREPLRCAGRGSLLAGSLPPPVPAPRAGRRCLARPPGGLR